MTAPDVHPDGYAQALAEAKSAIQEARTRAVLAVNNEVIGLYWKLGRLILDRQDQLGWGAHVIRRLSADLLAAFPDMTAVAGYKYSELPPNERGALPMESDLVRIIEEAILEEKQD